MPERHMHDWSKPPGDRPGATIRIGRMTTVRALSTVGGATVAGDREVIVHADAVATWTGPAGDPAAARALALSDAKTAWRAAATICGWALADLPAELSATFPIDADRRHNTMTLGPIMTGPMRAARRRSSETEIAVVARDALLAAASRARLPGPTGTVKIDYGQPGSRKENDPGHDLDVNVWTTADHWVDEYDVLDTGNDPSGPLRQAIVALGVAQTMSPDCEDGAEIERIDKMAYLFVTTPKSATLRAAAMADLATRAPERAARVAAFLRSVGLGAEALAFERDYGR